MAIKTDRGMLRNDSIGLCREQHAELYAGDGRLRLIVDHPSNARLMGTCAQACLVRAADLTVEAGDGSAIVYISRSGTALRIATAKAVRRKDGAIGLTEWRVEPGFDHAATAEDGAMVHRLTRTPGARR
ncbi:MAG: hypothetical protein HYZ40_10965 [Rhodospirillales bacterium]|nr:hypothetical protein [Rhodospirillales bacterium]TAJ27552.1 MAG: hypothetical protein EPO67_17200 [Reyranella sp.]